MQFLANFILTIKTKSSPGILNVHYTYDRSLIEILLPHRPPFLMVDTITSVTWGKNPSLLANYTIGDWEPAYSDHESEGHWPSIYIIEGLGQCCNLLIILSIIEKGLIQAGLDFNSLGEVLTRLMNDEPDEITGILKGSLHRRLKETYLNVGFLGSADIEITGHAGKGQVITYAVQQNQVFGSLHHSTVRAYTNLNLIASGTLVSAGRKN